MKNIKNILVISIMFLSFISLGIPDSSFGVAWTNMRIDLKLPIEIAGIVSLVTTIGTASSSFFSSIILSRLGTAKVTFISCILTGIALIGYSISLNLVFILMFTIPLGLGAGAVDTGLNNYVAKNYSSKVMNWLHCFWGIGAFLGANTMSYVISCTDSWRLGYRTVGILQIFIGFILFLSLPLWKKDIDLTQNVIQKNFNIKKNILKEVGVKESIIVFPLFMLFEIGFGLWMTSYMIEYRKIEQYLSGLWISFFFASIMLGRFITGFLTSKYTNKQLVRKGIIKAFIGIVLTILFKNEFIIVGIILTGLGIGPIYPCMVHETPRRFPDINSEVITGYQIGFGYIGVFILMPLTSFLVKYFSVSIIPWFLGFVILSTFFITERINWIMK